MDIRLTGKIDKSRIRHMSVPRASEEVLAGYRALEDASGVISDVMDRLGIPGVVGASVLKPTIGGKSIVGTALTVRNVLQHGHEYEAAKKVANRMAEFEAHNLAQPGDVLVIQGVAGVSNMGGISAQTGKRHGEVGAIIMGGIRDVAHSRAVDYPVWASEITPRTGKWRIETMEINGDVEIAGVRVSCGDLVYADDTGVCFVPIARAAEVLALAEKIAAAEEIKCQAIDAGVHIADLPKTE
ncbi:RraA family protein [Ottowia thiooxydans]|uniref:Putative 4-hydroxy-4-methyl-2-oxoglutarate aldolase n=1 Tax=Ottowia thiooxydans TaxID=219182 RepID=A0ABV2Q7A3_9BURK